VGVDVSNGQCGRCAAADLILIGLKPITVPEVVRQIRPRSTRETADIDCCLGADTAIEHASDMEIGVVRRCPILHPCWGRGLLRSAATVATPGAAGSRGLSFRHGRQDGGGVKKAPGRRDGLSGCGPAFIYSHSGIAGGSRREGRPAAGCRNAVSAQTTFGAAKMVLDDRLPSGAIEGRVTTPPAAPSRHPGTGRWAGCG